MNPITFDENTGCFIILKTDKTLQVALDNEAAIVRWNEKIQRYEQLEWEYEMDDETDEYKRVDEKWVEIK